MKQVTVFRCDHCNHYDADAGQMSLHEEECLREKRRMDVEAAAFWANVEKCRTETIPVAVSDKTVRALVLAGAVDEARRRVFDLMTVDINSSYLCEQIADEAIAKTREAIAREEGKA